MQTDRQRIIKNKEVFLKEIQRGFLDSKIAELQEIKSKIDEEAEKRNTPKRLIVGPLSFQKQLSFF